MHFSKWQGPLQRMYLHMSKNKFCDESSIKISLMYYFYGSILELSFACYFIVLNL